MRRIWTLSLYGNEEARREVQSMAGDLAVKVGASVEYYLPKMPMVDIRLTSTVLQTWTKPLSKTELDTLAFGGAKFSNAWPDYIVSSGPEVAAIALGIKAASGNKTKIVQIHNPNDETGTYDFPIADFDVIIGRHVGHKLIDAFGKADALNRLVATGEALAHTLDVTETSKFLCLSKLNAKKDPLLSIAETWASEVYASTSKKQPAALVRRGVVAAGTSAN